MIDSPALHHGGSLGAVDAPVRMFGMLLVIEALAVIVACNFQNVRALPRILTSHVIGSNGDISIFIRVMQAHQAGQETGHLLSPLVRVGVINLISDAPANDAGVIAVPTDPGRHVPPHPFGEESGIIIFRLWAFPHVEGLVQDQKAQSVRQLQKLHRRRIVTCPYGIHSHFPQDQELPLDRMDVHGAAKGSQVVMLTSPVDLDVTAV